MFGTVFIPRSMMKKGKKGKKGTGYFLMERLNNGLVSSAGEWPGLLIKRE